MCNLKHFVKEKEEACSEASSGTGNDTTVEASSGARGGSGNDIAADARSGTRSGSGNYTTAAPLKCSSFSFAALDSCQREDFHR